MINIIQREMYNALSPGGQGTGSLYGNLVATNIYNKLHQMSFSIENIKDEDIISEILADGSIDSITPCQNNEDNTISDYRFVSVTLNGIKKYLYDEGHKYSIGFELNHNPVSTVILGRNGAGKTSFYAAMEYVCLGEMFTEKLYNVGTLDFLRNKYSRTDQMSINLRTKGAELMYEGVSSSRNTVPAHFCSAWDVSNIEGSSDFSYYIYRQLGLDGFVDLKSRLKTIRDRISSTYETFRFSRQQLSVCFYHEILPLAVLLHSTDANADVTPLINQLNNSSLIGSELILSDEYTSRNLDGLLAKIACNRTLWNLEISEYKGIIEGFYVPVLAELIDIAGRLDILIEQVSKDQTEIPHLKSLVEEHNLRVSQLKAYRKDAAVELERLSIEPVRAQKLALFYNACANFERLSTQIRNSEYVNIKVSVEERLQQIDQFCMFLQTSLHDIFESVLKPRLDTIFVPILNDSLREDKLEVEIKFDASNTISVELKPTAEAGRQKIVGFNPSGYLNTFRFKLFTVACKFALASCACALYNENWPFVLDDIFDSSDFDNRLKVKDFIHKLVDSYCMYINGENKPFPLQLIFFTQDDVIGDSVFNGLKLSKMQCKLCRLQSYANGDKLHKESDIDMTGCIDSLPLKSHWYKTGKRM